MGGGGEGALRPLRQLEGALTALDLSYCGLGALPAELPCLRNLAELSLGGNLGLGGSGGVEAFHPLADLPALTRLDLTRCNMTVGVFDLLVAMAARGVCVKF